MNAHRINAGDFPNLSNGRNTDFFYIEEEESELAAKKIVELVKYRLPKYCHIAPSDIQVLSPMQRGVVGAANLNILLQEAINPSDKCLHRAGRSFRQNDKVMQIRNNYDKEVFNGDIGIISLAKKMLVLVGTKKAISYAVKHITVTKRNTKLKERLKEI